LLQKKALLGIIIAIVVVVAVVPTAYGLAQRSTVSGLKIDFNRVELSNVDFSQTSSIGSMQGMISSLDSPSLNTLVQYQQLQSSIATPDTMALDLLVNTRYVFDMYLDVTNPSSIEAVIDRAQVKASINDHELPGYITLAQQEKIAPGEKKTIELKGLSVSGKDIGTILVSTASNDFILNFNFAINSYYPTLFGEVPVPMNVNLKTYVIPQKPTLADFSQVAYNQNSYKMSFTNNHSVPLTGKFQVGVLKGNMGCNPNCFAPIDNGLATFLRIQGSKIFDVQVLEYNNINLTDGQTYTVDINNAALRNYANSAFITRWVPDYSSIPYTLTTEIAGVTATKTGEFHSSQVSTLTSIGYNIIRDFGYTGSKEFVSPKKSEGTLSTLKNIVSSFIHSSSSPALDTPSISLQASSLSTNEGDIVTFNGRLIDQVGRGISNTAVELKTDRSLDFDPAITTIYTDNQGYFSTNVKMTGSGVSNIYAIFQGSSNYYQARSNDVAISVKSNAPVFQYTTISLAASSFSASQGNNIVFSGVLQTQSGIPVANALIQVKQDRTLAVDPVLVSGYTDSGGRFSLNWTTGGSGTMNIYSVFEGATNFGQARSQELGIIIQ
jgi:hypothetical protein